MIAKYQFYSAKRSIVIHKNSMMNLPVAQLKEEEYSHAFEFYLQQPLFCVNEDGKGNLPTKPYLLYASNVAVKRLTKKGWKIKPVKSFDDYLVTRLKGKFLNRKTRNKELEQKDLVLVEY